MKPTRYERYKMGIIPVLPVKRHVLVVNSKVRRLSSAWEQTREPSYERSLHSFGPLLGQASSRRE